ncbi:2-keto-4-pentenoate hydratase [Sphingobium sp. CR28]|uniref:2-keto-4-pentenoate hydratase n=1 Tax=Sphingobium sp. CR28 TaxID=3400272 RepID=UPI003FEDF8CB
MSLFGRFNPATSFSGSACALAFSLAALSFSGVAQAAEADCPANPRVDAAAAAWKAHQQQPPLSIDLKDAVCFRNALLAKLAPELGPLIGYKVGIWSAAARATYKVDGPLVGMLYRNMMIPEGKPVSLSSIFAPMAEADFLVVIGDAGINRARTREEAYRHIRGYRPFIELADNHYPAPVTPDAGRVAALNVTARSGVMGAEVALPQTPAGFAALAALKVDTVISGPSGMREESAVSAKSLGDPVEIVLAARDLLRKEGIQLKAGDIISLGTLTPAHPPVAGERFTVRYTVGDRTSEISAAFTP